MAYVKDICHHKGEKVIIFAEHLCIFDQLENLIMQALSRTSDTTSVWDPALEFVRQWKRDDGKAVQVPCLPYIRIDGAVSSVQQIASRIDRFQNDDRVRVAIISIKSGGTGIELTAANHVLFCELSFNGDDLIQAEARAARIGQLKTVHISYLLLKDTIDEQVWSIVKGKLTNIAKVMDNTGIKFNVTERHIQG